jgi:hypothetical protein
MKIKTMRYERRWNLGNYEHEVLDFTCDVNEGEDVAEAFKKLRETVIFLQGSKVKKS